MTLDGATSGLVSATMSKKNKGISHCHNQGALEKFPYTKDEFDPLEFFRPSFSEGFIRKGTHDTAGVAEDGSFVGWRNQGCQACIGEVHETLQPRDWSSPPHNGERKRKGSPVKYLYSSLWDNPENGTRAEFLAYWKLLLDEDKSPWRCVLKGREWVKDGNKLIGYKLDVSDKPFQVVANLMFAMRMPYSQQGYLKSWSRFVKAGGFTPVDALYLCANMAVTKDDKIRFPYMGDYPFDTASHNMHYLNFVNGTPKHNSATINTTGCYRPCNSIWHVNPSEGSAYPYSDESKKNTLVQKLVSKKGEYAGAFKQAAARYVNNQGSGMPFAEAAAILQEKRGEWAT